VDCDILFDKSADTLSFTEGFCRDFLMKDDQVHINFHPNDGNCVFDQERKCTYSNRYLSIFPIIRWEKRLGTLFLTRFDRPFDVDDLVLLEIGSIGVSLEMLRLNEAEKNEALRQKSEVQLALDTLSYSEYQAVEKIFEELDGDRGLLVASKIADSWDHPLRHRQCSPQVGKRRRDRIQFPGHEGNPYQGSQSLAPGMPE